MNAFILFTIAAVTIGGYLVDVGYAPRVVNFVPELITAVTAVLIIVLGPRSRFRYVQPAYWAVFIGIALIMVCGALANSLEAGPMVAGLRTYLRPMPLFLLPAVYAFTESQVRRQMALAFFLALLQLPVAVYQRLFLQSENSLTGDQTFGTLGTSGFLSIFLVCAACVLTAAFVKKRIKPVPYFAWFLLLLVPTTINETKITVFLLPMGLLTTFIVGSRPGVRLKNAVVATCMLAIFGSIFVTVYDTMIAGREHGASLLEFFTDERRLDNYMNPESHDMTRKVGRGEALKVPLYEVAREPTALAFGFGIGNASESRLGEAFTGRYFTRFGPFLMTAASVFILEIGVLGLSCVLLLHYLVYRDSRRLAANTDGLLATLATGWAGVSAVVFLCVFYANLMGSETISYLFWYFSGLIAAHRMRIALAGRSVQ